MDQVQQTDLLEKQHPEEKKFKELQSIFVRNVEQELRAPLTIISGYAYLLGDGTMGALDAEQQQAVLAITNQAGQLRDLVERITILMAVKVKIAAQAPINLKEITAQVMEAQRARAKEAGIALVAHLPSNLPPVSGYSYHLRHVVDCLVDNGLKFTSAGGQVEVKLGAKAGWVHLTVTDTGIGIAPEELERIFGSFYQVDGTITRSYGGLGLGLTVVKKVVEAYDGQLEVESQPGCGSQFTIKMPALLSTTGVNKLSNKVKISQRILIVDDEETVAFTLQEGLKKLPNSEVSTAAGGRQALELFEQEPFDLLLTDYKMPDMDGLTLAEHVRQLYPQTVIMIITAHSSDELHRQAAGISIRHVLSKPIAFNELRRITSEVLQKSDNHQQ